MGGPYGLPAPPAHLSYLNEVWDAMEPALRARLGSVTLHDAETSLEPFNDWGGRGCHNLVPVLEGDGMKIASPGDVFDQPPGEIN